MGSSGHELNSCRKQNRHLANRDMLDGLGGIIRRRGSPFSLSAMDGSETELGQMWSFWGQWIRKSRIAGIGINSDIWWQWFEIFRMRLFDAPRVGANAEGGTGIQVRFPVSSQQT